jgi:hypothetical protein
MSRSIQEFSCLVGLERKKKSIGQSSVANRDKFRTTFLDILTTFDCHKRPVTGASEPVRVL